MEDHQIVDLFWARQETAISQSELKYGAMLRSLSFSLLASREDAEECVNDTYLDAWNAMPPARPAYLGAFLAKITRRISIDRWRRDHRERRGGLASIPLELSECIPDRTASADPLDTDALRDTLDRFLRALSPQSRAVFLRRYFYSQPIEQIARELHLRPGTVKVILHRAREALRRNLEQEELL